MRGTRKSRFAVVVAALAVALGLGTASAADSAHSTVGLGGYDAVSYHTGKKPLRGNGHHLAVHDGVTYLFANDKHRAAFEKAPERYVPAYGGYCAYGVSVGKKFVGDPDVWEIVDGRLYLNLDNEVKGIWSKDVRGNLEKSEAQWPKIRDKNPSEL